MSALEQEIIERIHALDEERQKRVLNFIRALESSSPMRLSASELLKLPLEERNRLVKIALESSANEDFEIFEAYSEENLDDEN
jgi:hypothetical protein